MARGVAEVDGGVMDTHFIRYRSADLVPSVRGIDDPATDNRKRPSLVPCAAMTLIYDLGIGNLAQWTG
jgi:hypothetical protein